METFKLKFICITGLSLINYAVYLHIFNLFIIISLKWTVCG